MGAYARHKVNKDVVVVGEEDTDVCGVDIGEFKEDREIFGEIG